MFTVLKIVYSKPKIYKYVKTFDKYFVQAISLKNANDAKYQKKILFKWEYNSLL